MNPRWRKRQVPLFLKVPPTFIFFLECKWAYDLLAGKFSSFLSLQDTWSHNNFGPSCWHLLATKHSTVEVKECWPFSMSSWDKSPVSWEKLSRCKILCVTWIQKSFFVKNNVFPSAKVLHLTRVIPYLRDCEINNEGVIPAALMWFLALIPCLTSSLHREIYPSQITQITACSLCTQSDLLWQFAVWAFVKKIHLGFWQYLIPPFWTACNVCIPLTIFDCTQ